MDREGNYCRWIQLSVDGHVPGDDIRFTSENNFDSFILILDPVWHDAADLQSSGGQRLSDGPEAPEVERAKDLWMQGHHSFFIVYQLLAHALEQARSAVQRSDPRAIKEWANYGASLWRCASGLVEYCLDFEPVTETYCTHIRAGMPEAFSGFWARESHAVRVASAAWKRTTATIDSSSAALASTELKDAEDAYIASHKRIMLVVPEGKSLAKLFREQYGCPHSIKEPEHGVYDEIFNIQRSRSTKEQFLRQACETFQATIDRISTGTRLSKQCVTDISQGMQVAIRIFGHWLGPVPETSAYYPRILKGY